MQGKPNWKKCGQPEQQNDSQTVFFQKPVQVPNFSQITKLNFEQIQPNFNSICPTTSNLFQKLKIVLPSAQYFVSIENQRSDSSRNEMSFQKFPVSPKSIQNEVQFWYQKEFTSTNGSLKKEEKSVLVYELSEQLYMKICLLEKQIDEMNMKAKEDSPNQDVVKRQNGEQLVGKMAGLYEEGNGCKRSIEQIRQMAENLILQMGRQKGQFLHKLNEESCSHANVLKELKQQIVSLNKEAQLLRSALDNKNKQIQQFHGWGDVAHIDNVVHRIYEIPVQMFICESGQLKQEQQKDEQHRSVQSYDDCDEDDGNVSEAEEIIKITESNKNIKILEKLPNCANWHASSNVAAAPFYQIPIEVCVDTDMLDKEYQSMGVQTDHEEKDILQQKLTFSFQQINFVYQFMEHTSHFIAEQEMALDGLRQIKADEQTVGRVSSKNKSANSVVKKDSNNQVYIIDGETSSEGSRTDREIRISQIKCQLQNSPSQSGKVSNMFTPYAFTNVSYRPPTSRNSSQSSIQMKESPVDRTDYFEQKERVSQLEEEKASLIHKLGELQKRMETYKKAEHFRLLEIEEREQASKIKMQFIIDKLELSDQKLQALARDMEDKTKALSVTQKLCMEKEAKVKELLEDLCRKEKQGSRLGEQVKEWQQKYLNSINSASQMNKGQQKEIAVLKNEVKILRQENESFLKDFEFEMQHKTNTIEKTLLQLEEKKQKIEQMKNEFHEVMINIQMFYKEKSLEENGDVYGDERLLRIYEGEYTKKRMEFGKLIEDKNLQIRDLSNQNIQYQRMLADLQLSNTRKQYEDIQAQEKDRWTVSEKEEGIDRNEMEVQMERQLCLARNQLQFMIEEMQYKQQLIDQLKDQVKQYKAMEDCRLDQIKQLQKGHSGKANEHEGFNLCLDLGAVSRKIDFELNHFGIHTSTSIPTGTNKQIPVLIPTPRDQLKRSHLIKAIQDDQKNTSELHQIILTYEAMLKANQTIIADLQNQVCIYLQHAIDKENENQMLERDLVGCEGEIDEILKEKITIEIQNKRMKKMIAASQRKISAIGARLIHAAKNKILMKQEITPFVSNSFKGIPKSQNSTIKLREMRME